MDEAAKGSLGAMFFTGKLKKHPRLYPYINNEMLQISKFARLWILNIVKTSSKLYTLFPFYLRATQVIFHFHH